MRCIPSAPALALAVAIHSVAWADTASTEPDCVLGKRYLALAQDRIDAGVTEDAIGLRKHAVEACPGYETYQALGELLEQSPEREDQQQAVGAFVAADDAAPGNLERARSLYHYAALLNRNGDPQNAFRIIKLARSLDPANPDIAALAHRVEEQIQHPSSDQLVRGLNDSLYQVLRRPPPRAAASSAAPRMNAAAGDGPSINIPINFYTATTAVDSRTSPNITTLARALADPSLNGRSFLFIGHADRRGGDELNLKLSKDRAEAMYRHIIQLEPSLKGRVDVTGHGSREPIDLGSDRESLRANRRLQVVLESTVPDH